MTTVVKLGVIWRNSWLYFLGCTDMGLILSLKIQEPFWLIVGIFWGVWLLVGYWWKHLFVYLGELFVRLVLISDDLVYWCWLPMEVDLDLMRLAPIVYDVMNFLDHSLSEVTGGTMQCWRRLKFSLILLCLFYSSKKKCLALDVGVPELNQGL